MKVETDNRFLCFSLGPEEYGIPLVVVKEVIANTEFTPVPFAPSYYAGIINLRGKVLSAIDLRKKFGLSGVPNQKSEEDKALIVCDLPPLSVGILVDSVNSVINPLPGDISPKPAIETTKTGDYVQNVCRKDDRFVLLLDLVRALEFQDLVKEDNVRHL